MSAGASYQYSDEREKAEMVDVNGIMLDEGAKQSILLSATTKPRISSRQGWRFLR